MNKAAIRQAILDALAEEFDSFHASAKKTRAEGNDTESKSEGKYDTRSIEENYLADGLAKQAQASARAAAAYEKLAIRDFDTGTPIDVGALVELEFPSETEWFFLGPAGGGIEVECDGHAITVLTPESPLGGQLVGRRSGDATTAPPATIRAVE